MSDTTADVRYAVLSALLIGVGSLGMAAWHAVRLPVDRLTLAANGIELSAICCLYLLAVTFALRCLAAHGVGTIFPGVVGVLPYPFLMTDAGDWVAGQQMESVGIGAYHLFTANVMIGLLFLWVGLTLMFKWVQWKLR